MNHDALHSHDVLARKRHMDGFHGVAGRLVLAGAVLFASTFPGRAFATEQFSMKIPPGAEFTYRVTATNQIIKPEPITLLFARTEPGTFCDKVREVGVNAGSDRNFAGGVAPGNDRSTVPPGDPGAELYRTTVGSSGSGLCNFQNIAVSMPVPPHTDAMVVDSLKRVCISISPASRRRPLTETNAVVFKVFLRKGNSDYEWRAPSPCAQTTPHYCRIPIRAICDPIPNRPPDLESVTVAPATLPAGGGTIKMSVVGGDDVGIQKVKANVQVGTSAVAVHLGRKAALGTTATGAQRSQWEGIHGITANPSQTPRTITINFEVVDGEGAVTPTGAKTVQQEAARDTTPPQILSFQLDPGSLPYSGGEISVRVKASDSGGIQGVRAVLIEPDGHESSVRLQRISGTAANGEWTTKWTMPANTDSTPLAYGVKVAVSDAANNVVWSKPLPLTVAARDQSQLPNAPMQLPKAPPPAVMPAPRPR